MALICASVCVMQITPRQRIAAEVRAAVAWADMNKPDLADQLGITPSGLSRKLTGERPFTGEQLVIIARATGVSAGRLLSTGPAPSESEAA